MTRSRRRYHCAKRRHRTMEHLRPPSLCNNTEALAQRSRLLGAVERGECIGEDAGRGLGPRMIFSERFFVGRESRLAARERFGRIAFTQPREILTRAIGVRMLGAEHLLVNRQRALIERTRIYADERR
jgi:hypothetical protein